MMLLLSGLALAGPYRAPLTAPLDVEWEPGLRDDVVLVKLVEGTIAPLELEDADVAPLFQRDPEQLRLERERLDPLHERADLTLWYRVVTAPGQGPELANRLNLWPEVEAATLERAPQRPPSDDIDPVTPDLSAHQTYLGPAPMGFGTDRAWEWPGGTGANVAFADVEYSWEPEHEDLASTRDVRTWGWDSGEYAYHGNGVLGIVVAGDNGFGVTGMAPGVEVVMVSPFTPSGVYNVAAAIDGAAALLEPGDVLLIEQQSYAFGAYCPVEVEAAAFDAIANAVAKGIVVVEPGGNGRADLDDAQWSGWFDRELQDSGAILVGGGVPGTREWAGGSSFGGRVDVQGWYQEIASTTTGAYSPDLFYGNEDTRQAYTSGFGGTSGASPQVASVAALFQSIAIAVHGEPFSPELVRALMVQTGTPQPTDDQAHWIGPQPNLRNMLRLALFY